jgi:hypothetical protein
MASPAKILTDLPADAVCQVLVALDDAYDIAQTASVCTLLKDVTKQAFVLRPHLAKVADLAKQVAQLEIDNAELQKHTIVPADQERLFAKLHTLEQAVEAQTARADKHKHRAKEYKTRVISLEPRNRLEEPRGSRSEGPRTIRYRIDPETGVRRVVLPNGRPALTRRLIKRRAD